MENTEEEIDINEFLKFLKIVCHVNDLIRETKEETKLNFIDFDELTSNKIVNELYGFRKCANSGNIDTLLTSMNTTSEKSCTDYRRSRRKISNGSSGKKTHSSVNQSEFDGKIQEIHPRLSKQLDFLINEGVLDSILPFVCPVIPNKTQSQIISKGTLKLKMIEPASAIPLQSKLILSTSTISKDTKTSNENTKEVQVQATGSDLSSLFQSELKPVALKGCSTNSRPTPNDDDKNEDYDVVIHVCDEIKNSSRDFTCPQKLLVSKMGYFADVTAGQKLEDMDISVHCDIQIFEWLMKWIQKNPDQQDSLPQLDATNVVPILVSASFLQMEPLLLDCLSFCHARLTDVVRSSTNLSCLNDSIMTRLAAMFTNIELEIVKDKRERVTPRLWTKLIQSLCEMEPQALRGHYFSLAGLFRCSKCGKYLTQTTSPYISCIPSNVRLNRWGQLISQHTRDLSWNLSQYVASLFKDLKSWRKVYWKLWGHCHFLYCCTCETHFPVYQMAWCRFHPEIPQFLGPVSEGRMSGPAGRYTCCGQQAFRYEAIPGPNGCKFREHSVLIETDRDRAIMTLLQVAIDGGNLTEDPTSKLIEEWSKSSEQRWYGLCLIPSKCRPGLLPSLSSEEQRLKESRGLRLGPSIFTESSSETETSDTTDSAKKYIYRHYSSSSDGCESETNSLNGTSLPRQRRTMELSGRYWSGELSARSNQDHQREFEEKVIKQVTSAITKKANTEVNSSQNNATTSGTYIRLEAEWREQLKQRHPLKLKLK